MNFCTQCGVQLNEIQMFCNKCGAAVRRTESEPTATEISNSPSEALPPHQNSKTVGESRTWMWAVAIGSLLLVAIVVGIVASNVHGATRQKVIPATSTAPPADLSPVSFQLFVCSTSHGVQGMTPANLPATVTKMVPASYATGLVAYADDEGTMEVLAPRGWGCLATIGADGSGTLQVAPLNQSVYTGALSSGSTAQEVSASETSACVGCAESQACPLFATAAKDYRNNYQSACPTVAPTTESIQFLSTHIVSFSDPPNVSGDASPSGGAYQSRGVMTYDSSNQNGSYMETCVLPPAGRSLCSASLSSFAASYGQL